MNYLLEFSENAARTFRNRNSLAIDMYSENWRYGLENYEQTQKQERANPGNSDFVTVPHGPVGFRKNTGSYKIEEHKVMILILSAYAHYSDR